VIASSPGTTAAVAASVAADGSIHRVLDARDVRAVYQPIADIDTGAVVAYEALARGPEGTSLERPDVLFAAAAAVGRLAELDWICRATAFRGALDAGLDPKVSLFVNSEPAALGVPCPDDLLGVVGQAEQRLRVVSELTERAIAGNPPAVLAAVAQARARGWAVALDDVGADPDSLAMMPFIRPDVVKLDMGIIQQRTDRNVARIMGAVMAYAERTGATILAEGIEHEEHLALARSLGAVYGQGWHFGRPSALPERSDRPQLVVPILPGIAAAPVAGTFELAASRRRHRRATKATLLAFSHQLEQHAMDNTDQPVLLSCFQEVQRFTPATRRRYGDLAERTSLLAALGAGMPSEPVRGVRGGDLDWDDPLRGEWTVIVVSPHHAAALIARDIGDTGPDLERRFDYVLTHDRELVVDAARLLLERVVPVTGGDPDA
jgi:EAL domain-containing protein (putative c-di-GMP-specific phosphodiesterase class I)